LRSWLISIIKENKFKIGAELGVYKGNTTFALLDTVPDLVIHAVDIFEMQPDHFDYSQRYYDFTNIYPKFLERAKKYGNRIIVHKGWTHEVANKIDDHSLDFVFIDADHEYEACKRDIICWKPKVRKGGFLMGHDIQLPGVLRAVEESCPNYEKAKQGFCWFEAQ